MLLLYITSDSTLITFWKLRRTADGYNQLVYSIYSLLTTQYLLPRILGTMVEIRAQECIEAPKGHLVEEEVMCSGNP